jgi:predicted RNA-binding protein with PIN domain
MPYLIDGHNLIPKIPGMDLGVVDDEAQLIEMLQEFCRRRRKKVEVYFDNAPAGQPRARNYGLVIARFARLGVSADSLIQAHLQRLGRAARNWTVVSSDQQVQAAARAARAQTISSEAFAREVIATLRASPPKPEAGSEAEISPDELDDWLALFGGGQGEKE